MSGTSLQPQSPGRPVMRSPQNGDPFMPLRRRMDQLFDDFFNAPMFSQLPMMPPMPMVAPQIEVSETDKEIQVAAELPGIDPNNIEVTLADDMLTIRGEKQSQQQMDQGRDYHLRERSYGTFARYVRLPFHADPRQVRSTFKDGVLTLTIPKPEEAQQKVHRIAVTSDGSSIRESQQSGSAAAQPSAKAAE